MEQNRFNLFKIEGVVKKKLIIQFYEVYKLQKWHRSQITFVIYRAKIKNHRWFISSCSVIWC